MINAVLKLNGAKFYDLYSYTEVKNATTGSKGKAYAFNKKLYALIQPTGSKGNVKGIMLEDTQNSGDRKVADFFMYSKDEVLEKQRIKYLNKDYEIRGVEPYESNVLKFYKSYLVKVDNQ